MSCAKAKQLVERSFPLPGHPRSARTDEARIWKLGQAHSTRSVGHPRQRCLPHEAFEGFMRNSASGMREERAACSRAFLPAAGRGDPLPTNSVTTLLAALHVRQR